MNSYEEKKQRRIDYYNEKAEKLEQESSQLAKESSKMISAIPMGQPLMPDYYSYQADKNYRERAWNKMDKSVEVGQKADYYRSKAEAAEKNAAISSDDPEAVKKLKDKLQKLEDFQNRMKKVNAYYRKNGTMKGFENLSDEKAAEIDEAVKNDYSWITAPYAPFQLSNNNAEINGLKKSELPRWNAGKKPGLSVGSLRAARLLPIRRKTACSYFLTKSQAKNSEAN